MSGFRTRLATVGDKKCLVRLLEMNGVSPNVSGTLRFLVAERGGKIGVAVPYCVEQTCLSLGPLISDPLVHERPLARLLYAEAVILARDAGLLGVRSDPVHGDYQYEVGYRRGWSGWLAGTGKQLCLRRELPNNSWSRWLAIWGATNLDNLLGGHKSPDAATGRESERKWSEH